MIIVGVDVETTGLDSDGDEIVELGVVLFDVESGRVIAVFGKVFKVKKWGAEAAQCHQIPEEISELMPLVGSEDIDPWDIVSGDLAKFVVAHNAPHDHAFVTKIWPSFLKKPWLCTQRDLKHKEFLPNVSSRRLGHLCVDYHIAMGSWHQAVADAEACARIAAKHDLDDAYRRKLEPKFRFITYGDWIKDVRDVMGEAPSVIKDGRRYRWNAEEAPKAWSKEDLTLEEVEEDAKYLKSATKGKWKFEGAPMPPKSY
jgi:DNA polymerase III epsilon subunit-like protein